MVKRKHRHILEVARALRFHSGLPNKFWGECVLTAVHIITRLPSRIINNQTPFEIMFGKKPNYNHLRVFGCLAYVLKTRKESKFDERRRACIFLGYPLGQKGYKVYDLLTKDIYVSRDVVFFEKQFPFKDNGDKQNIEQEKMPELMCMDDIIEPACNTHPKDHQNHETEHSEQHLERTSESEILAEENVQNQIIEEERRGLRSRQLPKHLQDYEVDLPLSITPAATTPPSSNNVVHPLSKYISYSNFSKSHLDFLSVISAQDEPRNFNQAVQHEHWREAMKSEIAALESNDTWTLTHLPPGKNIVDSKWIYKIKFKPNGDVECYKARLVARGFTQIEGEDFHETFAPVAKLVTMRCLISIAAAKGWSIHQLDVNNAFLHGDLKEEIYMKIPQGFAKGGDTRVCKLKKSLYGLRQESRNWYYKFTSALTKIGFYQSRADHSLFIYKRGEIFLSVLIYVDDVLLVGNDAKTIQ